MNPLITIIVPVYKVEKYLNRCVESIVNQTYKNLEIILVDDGSPDNCPQICDSWAKQDERIKVIHKENSGVFAARMEAVRILNGDYVTFIDSDDWVDPDLVEYLLKILIDNNAQISGIKFIDVNAWDKNKKIEKPVITEQIVLMNFEQVIKNAVGYMCGKLYDVKLFKNIPDMPDDIAFLEDTMLNFFLFKNCKLMALSNEIKYYYFRHSGSVSCGCISDKMINDSLKSLDFIQNHCEKNSNVYKYLIKNRASNNFFLINSIINNWKCLDRFSELRKDYIRNKRIILSKEIFKLFKKQYKIGIILIIYFPYVYILLIRIRRKLRGY